MTALCIFLLAAALGLFYLILKNSDRYEWLALPGVSMLGFSTAFVPHATNSVRCLPGIFSCTLAAVLELKGSHRRLALRAALFSVPFRGREASGVRIVRSFANRGGTIMVREFNLADAP